jgi:hypothetical protein
MNRFIGRPILNRFWPILKPLYEGMWNQGSYTLDWEATSSGRHSARPPIPESDPTKTPKPAPADDQTFATGQRTLGCRPPRIADKRRMIEVSCPLSDRTSSRCPAGGVSPSRYTRGL